MRLFYVFHKSLWEAPHYFAGERHSMGHGFFTEAHYIDLPGDLILLSGAARSDDHAAILHQIPHIGRLPHPVHEKDVHIHALHSLPEWAHKNLKQHHHEALVYQLGIHPTVANVWDVHRAAKAIHPLCRLDEVLY